MRNALLLGIDAGTTVIKATLFTPDGQELVTAARPSSLRTSHSAWAEADMDAVWEAVVAVVQEVLRRVEGAGSNRDCNGDGAGAPRAGSFARARGADAGDVIAVGVTGQGDGTWLVDPAGRPVRPAILWCDGRTAAMVQEAHRSGLSAAVFAITGTALNSCNQALHLRWLQEYEPACLPRTAAVLRAKDWLMYNLTGLTGTDETDASHTYFDVHARSPEPRLLDLLGIGGWRAKLPEARPAAANVAPLLPAVAARLGLRAGIPVAAGPFDVCASALGVGAVEPGHACSILGTAGVHQVVIERPILSPANVGYHLCHAPAAPAPRLLRQLPTMAATPNLHWFVREFCAPGPMSRPAAEDWEELERRAAAVPLGAEGVMYHPYIDPAGERAPFIDALARAQFTGLSMRHGRDVLLRAVYEGVALSALDCYATMGVPLTELRLAGGGARSALWAQILADALGCPVLMVQGEEHGARGAVINAGVAIGLYASHAEGAAHTVRVVRRFAPTAGAAAVYSELLTIYRATAAAMRPVWALAAAHRAQVSGPTAH